jgi:hypothetical protein
MSETDLQALVVRRCRLIAHGTSAGTDTVFTPRKIRVTAWNSDRYSRGCYSFVPRGMHNTGALICGNNDDTHPWNYIVSTVLCCLFAELWSELGRPENSRLFFAGEHTETSAQTRSSVRGAFLSGVRAAEEIVRQLGSEVTSADRTGEFQFPVCTPVREAFKSRW